ICIGTGLQYNRSRRRNQPVKILILINPGGKSGGPFFVLSPFFLDPAVKSKFIISDYDSSRIIKYGTIRLWTIKPGIATYSPAFQKPGFKLVFTVNMIQGGLVIESGSFICRIGSRRYQSVENFLKTGSSGFIKRFRTIV